MPRDPRLHGLSEDHHHALVLARRAARSARGEEGLRPASVWDEVTRRFAEELEPHFGIEEEVLLPALQRAGEGALVARTHTDHAALRGLLARPDLDVAARLAGFGERLEAHVRFEERELFPRAQVVLDDAALDAVARAWAARHR